MAAEAVRHVSLEEEVRVEVGRGLCRHTHTESVDVISGYHRVDGTYVNLAGIVALGSLHIVLKHCLHAYEQPAETLGALHTLQEVVHALLAIGQLHLAVYLPVLLVAHL